MDPVTLIVAALAAGAGAGAKGIASAAVKDSYEGLKALVRRRLAGRASGEAALREHEAAPETAGDALHTELVEVYQPDRDQELVAAARELTAMLDGACAGKYEVAVEGAQGVQIGDHNVQTNTYTTPAPSPRPDPGSYRG
ncbi:MAG: hypothetical protein H0V92_13320 [Pseudonocardiales bacterium]|nr:hypothetical protein [Pseudonocardiales bacterium]